MSFIRNLSWSGIADILYSAQSEVYLACPSIDEPLAQGLIETQKRGVSVRLCIDNSETAIRNGFGDQEAITQIRQAGIEIKEAKENRVSFLITDNESLIFFPESRILSFDPEGYNAIEIDGAYSARLINYFFPDNSERSKEMLLNRLDEDFHFGEVTLNEILQNKRDQITDDFDSGKYAKIQQCLTKNPPEHPDLTRKMRTYTSLIQFVEFESEGLNIENLSFRFPKDALPINDPALKALFSARMKAFRDFDVEKEVPAVKNVQRQIQDIRKTFLIPITCRKGKSIIHVTDKVKFEDQVALLNIQVIGLMDQIPEILQNKISVTKSKLLTELKRHFQAAVPKHLAHIDDRNRMQKAIDGYVNKLIKNVFPDVNKLVAKMKVTKRYYDLTWQDFSDQELLAELQEKDILPENELSQIINLQEVFKVKK